MSWLRENWFWVVFFVLFLWMHARMHGGHGSHGGHGGCGGHEHDHDEEEQLTEEERHHAQH